MAQVTEVVKIIVDGTNTKTNGVVDVNKVWYNLSKFNNSLTINQFVKGRTYNVEVVKGKQGSLYIQNLIEEVSVSPENTDKQTDVPSYTQRGNEIGHRGFIQAAIQAVSQQSLNLNPESLEENLRIVLAVMDKVLAERLKE